MRPTAVAVACLLLSALSAGCGGSEGSEQARPTNARGVPITPGGDNTIQSYGREAGGAQRDQADATLSEYAEARDSGNWATACELMSAELRAELRGLAQASSRLEGKPCATVAGFVDANLPRRSRTPPPAGAAPELVSFRVNGPNAIAIYTAEGDFYFMPFDRDRGEWLVSDLNGEALLEEGS
jgi:hypothetical protein